MFFHMKLIEMDVFIVSGVSMFFPSSILVGNGAQEISGIMGEGNSVEHAHFFRCVALVQACNNDNAFWQKRLD